MTIASRLDGTPQPPEPISPAGQITHRTPLRVLSRIAAAIQWGIRSALWLPFAVVKIAEAVVVLFAAISLLLCLAWLTGHITDDQVVQAVEYLFHRFSVLGNKIIARLAPHGS